MKNDEESGKPPTDDLDDIRWSNRSEHKEPCPMCMAGPQIELQTMQEEHEALLAHLEREASKWETMTKPYAWGALFAQELRSALQRFQENYTRDRFNDMDLG